VNLKKNLLGINKGGIFFQEALKKMLTKEKQVISGSSIALEALKNEGPVGKILSALRKKQLGVPQGSVIGPLLFILYMNDIVKAISHFQVTLFADDTLLFVSASTVAKCIEKMQEHSEKKSCKIHQKIL
jgi:hypothetical protein